MYKLFPGKTPFQMRREAKRAAGVKPPQPLGPVDPAHRPLQGSDDESDAAIEAAAAWLAHIAAGRIEVR